MGVEQALASTMITSMSASVYEGIEAKRSGDALARQYEKQANIAIKESENEAERMNRINAVNNAKAKLSFFRYGAAIEGSAEAVLNTNMNLQNEEVQAVLAGGRARADFYSLQGQNAKNEGRAQLIGGIMQGISSVAKTYGMAKEMGYFKGTGTTPTPSPAGTAKAGTGRYTSKVNQYGLKIF